VEVEKWRTNIKTHKKSVKGQRNNLGGCVPHSSFGQKAKGPEGRLGTRTGPAPGAVAGAPVGGGGIRCRRGAPRVPLRNPKEEAESINWVISHAGGIARWLGTNRRWGGRTHVEIALAESATGRNRPTQTTTGVQ